MQIRCDNCDRPIEKDTAIAREVDEGEMRWFCSEECYATARLEETADGEEERAMR